MGDGRWEMGDGRWEMGDGRWEMGVSRASRPALTLDTHGRDARATTLFRLNSPMCEMCCR
jgi:hypothetical protein